MEVIKYGPLKEQGIMSSGFDLSTLQIYYLVFVKRKNRMVPIFRFLILTIELVFGELKGMYQQFEKV